MQAYQYRAMALDCLLVNKRQLGITDYIASQILSELNDKHPIHEWKTEWLLYNDRWVYSQLKCIDDNQKSKLWSLVLELTVYFEEAAQLKFI